MQQICRKTPRQSVISLKLIYNFMKSHLDRSVLRTCHIWRPKLRGQFFKETRQSEDRDLYYVLVGFMYSAIFLPKRQNEITFRTMSKNFTIKNIKMRPLVPLFNLFKKSSIILYLFLKAKSQAKAYIIKTVVCCLRKRKDVKKTVKKKNR